MCLFCFWKYRLANTGRYFLHRREIDRMADNQTEKQKVQELTDRLERHNRGIIGYGKMLRKMLQKYMKNHRKMLQEAWK